MVLVNTKIGKVFDRNFSIPEKRSDEALFIPARESNGKFLSLGKEMMYVCPQIFLPISPII